MLFRSLRRDPQPHCQAVAGEGDGGQQGQGVAGGPHPGRVHLRAREGPGDEDDGDREDRDDEGGQQLGGDVDAQAARRDCSWRCAGH